MYIKSTNIKTEIFMITLAFVEWINNFKYSVINIEKYIRQLTGKY